MVSQADYLSNVDNTAEEEDVRAWFPCPFCYVEIEVQMLCNHLQEEHCFDFRNAVMQTSDNCSYVTFLKNICIGQLENEQ